MAVDGNGNVASPSYVTGVAAAWTVTHVKGSGGLSSVSCPSSGLCVAGDYLGNVVTSTSPTGGAGAWPGTHVGSSIGGGSGRGGVWGPETDASAKNTLCVAGGPNGNML